MRRKNLYPTPAIPLVNDGSKGDTSEGGYDVTVTLPQGDYVFTANVTSTSGIKPRAMIFNNLWKPLAYINDTGKVQAAFTLDKAQIIRVRASQTGVTLSNISVASAADHALASGGGLPSFFTAGTAPY